VGSASGAKDGFSARGAKEGLSLDAKVGELVLTEAGTARGSAVLYTTVGSAVGMFVGVRLKSDGVGRSDTKSVFVGWPVAALSSCFVGASVGCSQYGVGAADTKSVFVG